MSEENTVEMNGETSNQSGFYERLTSLPVVTEAMNQTAAVYNTVKNKHPLTQYACNTGESVVKRVADTAYNVGTPIAGVALKVAQPIVGNPVDKLDNMATETLVKCEEQFPIITKPTAEILSSTVEAIKGKADDGYTYVNNTRIAKFANARINEALSLSELAVEVLLPSDPNCQEDVQEEVHEAEQIKQCSEAMETRSNFERVVALGKRIQRRGSNKLLGLKSVQFTYDNVVSAQENMTKLIHRSQETSKVVQEAVLVIPNLALKLTGEAVVNAKAFVIAFKNAYSLNDIPGSIANVSGQVIKPVTDATGNIIGQLLLPPKMVAEYILSSKPIQCLIPNVVAFEEISKMEIEMDELAEDTETEDDGVDINDIEDNED